MIERVRPQIDGGLFPIKRVLGEKVIVEADIFCDGHDSVSASLIYRHEEEETWSEAPMELQVNDRWHGHFVVLRPGTYLYSVSAWVDPFKSWQNDLRKKLKAAQDVSVELLIGARWLSEAAERAGSPESAALRNWSKRLADRGEGLSETRLATALSPAVTQMMEAWSDRSLARRFEPVLRVTVDPKLAQFGAWYEMFPRSASPEAGRPGTFQDVIALLPRIAGLGFDVLYLPPIHPIGRTLRKGRNNDPVCRPEDVGSPWGIGSEEGGHKAIHRDLGTLDDFRELVSQARARQIEVALDIAFQCSPDHPYVKEHPEWFKQRPDGTIQYAENPPKKYQDIYPFDFESPAWESLWAELKSIFDFWIEHGVRVFRVDNPHTKAFPFWEWVLGELKRARPELIFLSEAFTRPRVMYRLAKLGFTQSYNYFPWRNTKAELTEYFTELTQTEVREFFRASLWPNTPDILTQYLQYGGRPAFVIRLILAATLGASYGIYGPAFELCLHEAREPGSEEYLHSEKYERKVWNWDAPGNLSELIRLINRIRRENPALQRNDSLRFHPVDNEQIIAYSKVSEDGLNMVLTVVNLDPHHTQRGWLELTLQELNLPGNASYQVHDLLTGMRHFWQGRRNYVELDPKFAPAHLFRLRQRVRTEHDFDYYL